MNSKSVNVEKYKAVAAVDTPLQLRSRAPRGEIFAPPPAISFLDEVCIVAV